MTRPQRSWAAWKALLAGQRLPCAVIDLDALDHNLGVLLAALPSPGPTIRLASKSVRCPAVLAHVQRRGGSRVHGLMTYAPDECALLAAQGMDDFLAGYPVGRIEDAQIYAQLMAGGTRVIPMVDAPAQVALLSQAALDAGVELPLCMDLDLSLRVLGQHFGVRRSPIRGPAPALALAEHIRRQPGVRLAGLMAYEAQVAGVPDAVPGDRWMDPPRRMVKARSVGLARARRGAVVTALQAAGHTLELVNGGGTGSISSTGQDPVVTEVTAGSGLLCPTLFDHYGDLDLRPAAFFALGVVRQSDPDHLTCAGGGYIASGPPGADRAPQVHAPAGLQTVSLEGFGEVQTPFQRRPSAPRLGLGDPVICRHAKSGELFERFAEVLLVRGAAVVDRVPTHRGLGGCFW